MDASSAEEQDGWQGGIVLKHRCSLGYKPHVKNSLQNRATCNHRKIQGLLLKFKLLPQAPMGLVPCPPTSKWETRAPLTWNAGQL